MLIPENISNFITLEDIEFFEPENEMRCTYRPSTGCLVFNEDTYFDMVLGNGKDAAACLGRSKDNKDKSLFLKVVHLDKPCELPSTAFRFYSGADASAFLKVKHLFMYLNYPDDRAIKFKIERVSTYTYLFKLTQE